MKHRACRVCHCTDEDFRRWYGRPIRWVAPDLCRHCEPWGEDRSAFMLGSLMLLTLVGAVALFAWIVL